MSKHDDFVKTGGDMTFPADAPQDVTPQATAAQATAAHGKKAQKSTAPQLSCGTAAPNLSKLPACVLSDGEILDLVHESLSPDSLCWGEENGKIVGGLWGLAEEVGAAMRAEDTELMTEDQLRETGQRGQIIYALRAFYRLGVLRGLETYRNHILNNDCEPVFAELPFALDAWAAEDFADDLRDTTPELLDKLLALVGVSGPTLDGKEGR